MGRARRGTLSALAPLADTTIGFRVWSAYGLARYQFRVRPSGV